MLFPSLFVVGGAAVAVVSLFAKSGENGMTIILSLAHKSGQQLMAGLHGKALNADLKFLIQTLTAVGVILFSRNLGPPFS
jgi:hypothetical protein